MRQSVKELAALYQNNLFAAAFNICKNTQDAEDVVQDTFVQYYTTKKEFEDEQHIRAWLIRVTVNKAKNITRTFWRRNKISVDGACGNYLLFKPHKIRVFNDLEGVKMGGLPPICHRNSEKPPKT